MKNNLGSLWVVKIWQRMLQKSRENKERYLWDKKFGIANRAARRVTVEIHQSQLWLFVDRVPFQPVEGDPKTALNDLRTLLANWEVKRQEKTYE